MSLGHSPPTRGEPGSGSALPPRTDSGERGLKASGPGLVEDVVPVRAVAERELDREREERVRSIVAGGRRALPRPSSRSLALGAIGLAAILIAVALSAALSDGGANPSPSRGVTPQSPRWNTDISRQPHADAPSLQRSRAAAHTRRRAAIRAKREAARRRAKQRSARKLAAHRIKEAHRSPRQESQASTEASSAETASTPDSVGSTSPAPSSTQSSNTSSPTEREFGFER